ncbi:hypothetical protein HKD37_10G029876 [Glycine soja]
MKDSDQEYVLQTNKFSQPYRFMIVSATQPTTPFTAWLRSPTLKNSLQLFTIAIANVSLPKMPRKISLHLPRLFLFLKKLVKRQELKLLRHYDYGEYQFSASSTPLIHRYHRKEFKNRGHRGLCSFLYLCRCLGNLKVEGSGECQLAEGLPNGNFQIEDGFIGAEDEGEEESVDEKAERFIESFYQQIRMQRQESL